MNIERSAVGEEVSSLHGVCVYSSRVHVVKKVAERIHRCSAAEADMECTVVNELTPLVAMRRFSETLLCSLLSKVSSGKTVCWT